MILAAQAVRTRAQIKHFHAEEKAVLEAFADVMPDFYTAENLPKLDKLLQAAAKDSKYFVGVAKAHFQRKRPYLEDDRIHPLGLREEDFAYPSGHATRGIVCAAILAQLEPSRAGKLTERGQQIGWDRVIGGMHHPSDIVAGRVLGQAVARALLRSPSFQADLKEVKEEYEAFKEIGERRPADPALTN